MMTWTAPGLSPEISKVMVGVPDPLSTSCPFPWGPLVQLQVESLPKTMISMPPMLFFGLGLTGTSNVRVIDRAVRSIDASRKTGGAADTTGFSVVVDLTAVEGVGLAVLVTGVSKGPVVVVTAESRDGPASSSPASGGGAAVPCDPATTVDACSPPPAATATAAATTTTAAATAAT